MIISNYFNGSFSDFAKAENSQFPDFIINAQNIIKSWLSDTQSFILYTSGTSNTIAKPFSTSRLDLIKSVNRTAQYFNLDNKSTLWCTLDPKYTGGFMMIIRALVLDCSIKLSDPKSSLFKDFNASESIDLLSVVPIQFYKVINDPKAKYKFNRIKNVLIGGASINNSLIDNKLSNFKKTSFFISYGMTETLSHVAIKNLKNDKYYNALEDISFRVNQNDELIISGLYSNISLEFATNDKVKLINNTQFLWLERSDIIINTGGIKVNPIAIEDEIYQYVQKLGFSGDSFSFAVSSIPDTKLGEKIILVVDKKQDLKQLRHLEDFNWLKNSYTKPRAFYRIEEIPRTSAGKIKYTQLKQIVLAYGSLIKLNETRKFQRKKLFKKFEKEIRSKIEN